MLAVAELKKNLQEILKLFVLCCLLAVAASAEASTIWNGPRTTISKLRSNDQKLPAFQDRLTSNVWLTRGASQGIYNIKKESTFTTGVSPVDTEWSYGTTAELPNLKFADWVTFNGRCPPCSVGKDAVVHLISDDIYIDIKFTYWPSASGDYSYERSTPTGSILTTNAVEYYNSGFNHYFMTANPQEALLLDTPSTAGGWTRTGQSFTVYTGTGPGLLPVCRFFSASFAPLSSHFYTANPDECAGLQAGSVWQYEGIAFNASLPTADNCAAGTVPLYRLYNNGMGGAPNHRFTTCSNISDRMVASGWILEGVGLCVAGETFDCTTDYSYGTVPGPPLSTSGTPGNANITIAFKPPASDGNQPILSYTARCISPGGLRTATNTISPITVRGLANGVSNTCTVVATNSIGDGPASLAVLVTPTAASSVSYNPLAIPPLLGPTMVNGIATYDLTLAPATKQLVSGGPATNTYSYNNQGFWGPTLLLNKGDLVQLRVHNGLSEETTTHWHGLLLPGAADGGPHSVIEPGSTWVPPTFTVTNNAATYWYHPHEDGATQKQITLGAGGFLIIRDDEEAALALPRTYGVDDIPLTLTSRRYTTINGVANQFQYEDTAYGDVLLSNGTTNAQVTLPKQMVRLRLLNAEVEREYNVGFNDGRTFYVIGNDGGLLSAPMPVTQLIMAPGERYEVIVDLTKDTTGNSINLEAHNGPDGGLSDGFAGYENASTGEFGSALNYRTFTLLHINIGAAIAGGVTTLPTSLAKNVGLAELTSANASQSRQIAINDGDDGVSFTFNGLPFDMNRIDQAVALGATESWTVTAGSNMSHSFHIHGVQFRVVARDGDASKVNPWEQGWKDTVYIPIREGITFIARFDSAADANFPFMYHCHMLNHEDGGLMAQFTVQ